MRRRKSCLTEQLSLIDPPLVAVDGSVLEALPRMVWALWLRKQHNGVRLHLGFDILKGIPVGAEITTARTSETARLKKRLEKGRLYVYDRGFADYGLFQAVIDAGSSFVGRVQQNAVFEAVTIWSRVPARGPSAGPSAARGPIRGGERLRLLCRERAVADAGVGDVPLGRDVLPSSRPASGFQDGRGGRPPEGLLPVAVKKCRVPV